MGGGDVRISGRAVEVTDPGALERYAAGAGALLPFHLFRAAPTEAVRTRVDGEEIALRSRVPGRPARTTRRGDDAPPRRDAPGL
ncbi:hypothetical protein [Streptomyces sp. NPDC093071]|uniref:hypothetical protein n=1 Tax=Streptomyces sp. NPDC093071 TaxID=3366022 RepID=UPI003830F190